MKVISKKGNRKLLKGHVYETDFFNNDHNQVRANQNYRYSYKRISIKDRGYYSVDDFTQTDGKPLPEIVYDRQVKVEPTKITDLKKGDVIVCLSDQRFKYLIKGGKYRIADVRIKNSTSYWSGSRGDIRLEGYNRWLKWSTWRFRKLTIQESRDLALSQIFDKEENFSVEFKRKFELKSDKDIVLVETLAKSILDKNRHQLGIMDWGIEKSGEHFKLTKEDFTHLMDKPLKEILEMFDNFSE